MSLEVMLDIETMSVRSNAAIVAIGAVKFDPRGPVGELGDPNDPEYQHFHVSVDLGSCIEAELHVEGRTVMWWMDQSNEARAVLRADPNLPLDHALSRFFVWFGQTPMPTWGNGAGFDNVIVRNAYDQLGGVAPFRFYDDRCFRTMKALAPNIPYVKPLVPHNALEDAKAQAVHLQKVFAQLVPARD
jgi:exodeoxyribonuclease VIII